MCFHMKRRVHGTQCLLVSVELRFPFSLCPPWSNQVPLRDSSSSMSSSLQSYSCTIQRSHQWRRQSILVHVALRRELLLEIAYVETPKPEHEVSFNGTSETNSSSSHHFQQRKLSSCIAVCTHTSPGRGTFTQHFKTQLDFCFLFETLSCEWVYMISSFCITSLF